MALLPPAPEVLNPGVITDTANGLQDAGVPSWAVALLIWSSAMVILAIATFRAGQILLRVMPDQEEDEVDRENGTPVE